MEEEEEEEEEQVIQFPCEREEEGGEVGNCDHMREEDEEEGVAELPNFSLGAADSQDLDEFFLPGTTPPRSERLLKQERRMYKHKKVSPSAMSPSPKLPLFKSMSSSDVCSEPFPNGSYYEQPRRSTVPAIHAPSSVVKGRRRAGGKCHSSPLREEGEGARGYKKIYQRDRERHRDQKTKMNEEVSAPHVLHCDGGVEVKKEGEYHQEEKADFDLPADDDVDFVNSSNHQGPEKVPCFADYLPIPIVGTSHSDGQSVFHSLTSQGFMMIGYEPPKRKLQRSLSDIHSSLPYQSKAMVCPPDRKKFYRKFMRTVKIYSHQQQHIPMPGGPSEIHIPRQRSEDLGIESPFDGVMDSIWVELRAYIADRKNNEQIQHDYRYRSEVECILDDVQKYRFTYRDDFFVGTNERDEYEQLTSIPSEAVDEPTPHCSLTSRDAALQNEEGGGGSSDNADDGGPGTLVNQGSLDSEGSSNSGKNVYPMEIFLNSEQQAALKDVQQQLRELERAEALFPSLKKMANEFSVCLTPQFKRRKDALILWSKVTEDLANHLSWLSKWFGVTIYSVYSHQSSQEYPPTHSPYAGPSRASTSNGDSPRKALFSQISVASAATTSSSIDPEQSLIRTSSLLQTQSSSASTYFSSQLTISVDEGSHRGYRKFVDRTLKKKGLEWLMSQLNKFIASALMIAEEAITVQRIQAEEEEEEEGIEESTPLIRRHKPHPPFVHRVTSTAPLSWLDEFVNMNLPLFSDLVRREGEGERVGGTGGEHEEEGGEKVDGGICKRTCP